MTHPKREHESGGAPFCGACGQYHEDNIGVCDLDPANERPLTRTAVARVQDWIDRGWDCVVCDGRWWKQAPDSEAKTLVHRPDCLFIEARDTFVARDEAQEQNELWAMDQDKRLRGALYALNTAIDPEWPDGRLVRMRNEVHALGVDLYGWTD